MENTVGKDTFAVATDRVFLAAGCTTQAQLAEFLEIRQSSVADAKRRRSIPAEWLLKLLRHDQTNPDWILTGQGSRYLRSADDNAARAVRIIEIRPPEACTAQVLVNELVRRAINS